jgi:hypothetical protein
VTTAARFPQQRRRALGGLALLATLATVLVAAAPAAAAKSCGEQVIDDWYDDGRVDRTYALHCYDDAIEALPRDVRDYSSAREDIQRALQARIRGEPAPPATTDPSPGDGDGPSSPTDPDDPTATTPDDPTETDTTGSSGSGDDGGAEAAPPTGTESASSVPLPLLVLAGLALLLVLGGAAGYLARRLQARRLPPPAA